LKSPRKRNTTPAHAATRRISKAEHEPDNIIINNKHSTLTTKTSEGSTSRRSGRLEHPIRAVLARRPSHSEPLLLEISVNPPADRGDNDSAARSDNDSTWCDNDRTSGYATRSVNTDSADHGTRFRRRQSNEAAYQQ
jgi:hypothetical protein